jgi:hypothetical protein
VTVVVALTADPFTVQPVVPLVKSRNLVPVVANALSAVIKDKTIAAAETATEYRTFTIFEALFKLKAARQKI